MGYAIKRFRLLFIFLTIFVCSFYFSHPVFASTNVTDDISENITWNIVGSPYVVQNDIFIFSGATLTIEPGVIVKFANHSSLNVAGNIIANGTVNNQIIFTSINDDSVGGDTNEDLDMTIPQASDWSGFYFIDSQNSSFTNVDFRYAANIFTTDNSAITFQDIDMFMSDAGIVAFDSSHITVDNMTAQNIRTDVLVAGEQSTINANHVEMQNITQYTVTALNGSTISLDNSSIKDISQLNAISILNDSIFTADHLDVENFEDYNSDMVDVFNHSNVLLDHSTFKNCPGGACITFYDVGNYINTPSSITVSHTLFDGGMGSAFMSFGTSAIVTNISNNTIKNFDYLGIEDYNTTTIHAENNYWGDASGPYNETQNPNGLGSGVTDNVDFIPFLTTDPLIVRTPVILIPGIMGSYLDRNFGDDGEVWININHMITSISDDFLNDLALRPDGTEDPAKPIQVGDIIRTITANVLGTTHVTHSFDGLIDELESGGYTEGTDLFVFPYDWRKNDKDATILLDSKIVAVLAQTGASKVDIVAHSMGGLVAKEYIAQNGAEKIDKLIFLGTPHLGAPKAYKVLTYGDDMGINILFHSIPLLNANRVKFISQNMPGVFELLPSQKYITDFGPYVTNAKINHVQDLDYTSTKDFMNTQGRNTAIFTPAESVHNDIDNLNLLGTDVYNFAGCGKTKTIGKIRVGKKRDWTHLGLTWKDDVSITYTNGDETVPLSSATSVDAFNTYFVKNISHMDLPSADGLKQDVLAILSGSALPSSPVILSDEADCTTSGHTVSVHSPATLDIYDSLGNHTGLNADGDIEYGIPAVSYDIFDDVKYAFLPDGQDYKIVNHATDTGGYSLAIDDVASNDEVTNTFSWNLVPFQTLNTSAEINIGPSFPENEYVLKADENGDGTFEKNFPVNFDGTSLAEKAEEKPHHSSGGSILVILDRKDDNKKEETEVKNIPELEMSDLENLDIKGPTLKSSVFKRSFLKGTQGATLKHLSPDPVSQTASAINSDFNIKNILTILSVCILAFIIGRKLLK
ncbi:MAG: hypothetical protein NTW62_02660 [Candidatus Nomurabacteria bacterium]|nr:hypothetical protein [Candidatus Nomurabacteria bacterium]